MTRPRDLKTLPERLRTGSRHVSPRRSDWANRWCWDVRGLNHLSRGIINALGFGVWHLVDAIFPHWILGLHRIRMDVEYPLIWDLFWLCNFGIVPLAIGLCVRLSKSLGANAATLRQLI